LVFTVIFAAKRLIMNLVEELKWRGMLHDSMPGTEAQLLKEMTTGYVGFDPTANSLHIGSLVPIILLVHLQKAGHKPIALVGGATGLVGDPSGKSEERNLLDEATLQHNLAGIQAQLERFLNFDPALPNAAEIVNNYDWFKEMSFLQFIRDVGKHITVNYMMAKDSVKKRLDGETGMSFTEFSYQLVQGYDFYWLHQHRGCKLQMGGSDQWGNIVTGTELIRRKGGGEAFAITCPLITKADGGKFGKTEKGNIWLDSSRTNAYEFYQFWLRSTDDDAAKWIKIFTFLEQPVIEALLAEHDIDRGAKKLQKKLAEELTIFIHGQEGLKTALETTEKVYSQEYASADALSEEDLQSMDLTKCQFATTRLHEAPDVVSFLAESAIFTSKGEARKMVQGGGVFINRIKVEDAAMKLDEGLLLHGKYLLVQKGKKSAYLVTVS
jgi:tyrosyl-tRNA synthetase